MKPKRIALFDILKGTAILMVCITHFGWEDQERTALLFPFWISMAVPIFMVVTGYLTAASYERKSVSFRELYQRKNLLPKCKQFLKPFAIVFLMELLLEGVLHHHSLSLQETVFRFLTGGIGIYGTYYVPILLQMLLLFPLIYTLLKRNRHLIVVCFLVNLCYESQKDALGITTESYRLLALRYVFLISMGCYLYLERGTFRARKYLPMLALGIAYIYRISYTAQEPVLFTRWSTTSMITAFYVAPIVAFLLKRCQNLRVPFLERIGRASYHIFLMQILFYNYFQPYFQLEHRMATMLLSVAICLFSGCLYFTLDQKCSAADRAHRSGETSSAPRWNRLRHLHPVRS